MRSNLHGASRIKRPPCNKVYKDLVVSAAITQQMPESEIGGKLNRPRHWHKVPPSLVIAWAQFFTTQKESSKGTGTDPESAPVLCVSPHQENVVAEVRQRLSLPAEIQLQDFEHVRQTGSWRQAIVMMLQGPHVECIQHVR
jgi:hypothetical protein